jgi:hypothetical protein
MQMHNTTPRRIMMKQQLSLVFAAALFAATPALAADSPSSSGSSQVPYNCDFSPACEVAPGVYGNLQAPTTSKFNLSIGGFVKLDYAYNSANLGPNGFLTATDAPKNSSQPGQKDQSTLDARASRLWFKSNGPTLLGAKTTALLELDFYNSQVTNASNLEAFNAAPRMRHAYANLDWGNTQLLFGQTGENFGLFNANTVDFNAGIQFGYNNGYREPQIRLTQKVDLTPANSFKFVLAVEQPTQTNYNNNGTNVAAGNTVGGSTTGDSWGALPNFVGQALFVSKALGSSPTQYGYAQQNFTTGFFGVYGNQHALGQTNDKTIDTWGVGYYSFVPILASVDGKSRANTLTFEGQAYIAANFAGNVAAQYTGTAGNLQPAKGFGVATQLLYYPTQNLSLNTGYGRREAYNYSAYANSGINNYERYNQTFFANVFYDLNAAVRVGAEYQHVDTRYGHVTNITTAGSALAGLSDYGKVNTARLALYYFF